MWLQMAFYTNIAGSRCIHTGLLFYLLNIHRRDDQPVAPDPHVGSIWNRPGQITARGSDTAHWAS